jgi:hypothetical protein
MIQMRTGMVVAAIMLMEIAGFGVGWLQRASAQYYSLDQRQQWPQYQTGDWRSMPQQQARAWIIEQARQFCQTYPSDPYCRRAPRR